MPSSPIVEVNNKLRTIVLGCALLPNEKAETFKWVFEQWMLAMDNVHPDNIMSDQDGGNFTSYLKGFPLTVHRCCFWHVK
jgi:hypothetical protein